MDESERLARGVLEVLAHARGLRFSNALTTTYLRWPGQRGDPATVRLQAAIRACHLSGTVERVRAHAADALGRPRDFATPMDGADPSDVPPSGDVPVVRECLEAIAGSADATVAGLVAMAGRASLNGVGHDPVARRMAGGLLDVLASGNLAAMRSAARDGLALEFGDTAGLTPGSGSRTPWTPGQTERDGVVLAWRRAGQGPPLLLLHGVGDDSACWGSLADLLAQDHTVLALDQRGNGRSGWAPGHYRLTDFAEDAAAVLRELGMTPAAVVGHSMGARVGLRLALDHPEVVTGLALIDPPLTAQGVAPLLDTEDTRRERYLWAETMTTADPAQRIELARSRMPKASLPDLRAWVDAKSRADPALWRVGGVDLEFDWRVALAQVSAPMVVVRGAPARGSIVGDGSAAEAAVLGARVVDVPQGGHHLHLEVPQATHGALRTALRARIHQPRIL